MSAAAPAPGPKEFDRPRFLRVFTALFFVFLFAPIALVALFSFNSTRSLQNFKGFSFQWYERFFENESLRDSLIASLQIAFVTMVVATALGTLLAFALVRAHTRWAGSANVLMLIPLVTPEIVAAVSALVLFTQIGLQLSLLTFALSFDDFVISFFTTGESPQPLPVRIYSAIRFGVTPTINAIGTMMLTFSTVLIALAIGLPRLLGRRESGLGVLVGRETA